MTKKLTERMGDCYRFLAWAMGFAAMMTAIFAPAMSFPARVIVGVLLGALWTCNSEFVAGLITRHLELTDQHARLTEVVKQMPLRDFKRDSHT